MRAILAVPLCLCAVLTGCLDTARIKRAPLNPTPEDNQQTDVPGVPFYIKVAQCKQETTWLQPYYTLTLKRTEKTTFADEAAAKEAAKDPKNPPPPLPAPVVTVGAQVLSLSGFQAKEVQQLRALVNGQVTPATTEDELARTGKAIQEEWRKIIELPPYLPLSVDEDKLVGSADAPEVANKSWPEMMVDYSRAYYYNTPRPWVGTSTSNPVLASDGTLTQATSTVNSTTLQTLLGALPISSVLSTVASAALKAPALAAREAAAGTKYPYDMKRTVEYELTIQQSAYTHAHSRYKPFEKPCPVASGGVTGKDYALSIEAYPPPPPPPDTNKPAPTVQKP